MEAWERFLSAVEVELGPETVARWLRSLKIVDFDACNLYLEAKDAFQVTWFEEQMRSRVQKELVNNNHRQVKVHLTTAGAIAEVVKNTKKEEPDQAPPEIKLESDPLDPHATFDRFIAGEANQVVFKLLTSLSDGTEKAGTFNPIYIHGPSGSGKTHLLMAATEGFLKRGINALYVKAETFTEHVVSAIRSGAMREFRQSYRHADVLIVDDVHVFARKSATQEEFFHTFNTLHTTGRQIILSGDRAPQSIDEIEPRLISRFEWGIILPLSKLDQGEMNQMVASRCQALNFGISKDVIGFLTESFPSNPKALHRALEALVLRTHLENRIAGSLSVENAKKLLADLLESEQENQLTAEKIVHATADYYGIRVDEVLGKSQSQECTLPRQASMYLCRMKLNIPFLKIGSLFGRDHSTVMTSVKQIQKRIDGDDKELKYALNEILKKLETS